MKRLALKCIQDIIKENSGNRSDKMKLYVSDLDGTLLRNNASISEFSKMNLNLLLSGGMHFTVASARSVVSMKRILGDVNFRLPIVEFNGDLSRIIIQANIKLSIQSILHLQLSFSYCSIDIT